MNIASQSTECLTLHHRPWFLVITCFILGAAPALAAFLDAEAGGIGKRLVIFLIGLGVMCFVVWKMPFITLTFDKPQNEIRLTYHRITGNRTVTYSLLDLEEVAHQVQWSDNSRLERLTLKMKNGPVPVEPGFGTGDRHQLAKYINEWILW